MKYAVTPPAGGDHNPTWLNCGIYDKPVPNENAVHDLEHGTIWITYRPSLPASEVAKLRAFVERQSVLSAGGQAGSRYMDLTPYPGLPAPIIASSWGFQLRLASPADPRLQQFVNKFRSPGPTPPSTAGHAPAAPAPRSSGNSGLPEPGHPREFSHAAGSGSPPGTHAWTAAGPGTGAPRHGGTAAAGRKHGLSCAMPAARARLTPRC